MQRHDAVAGFRKVYGHPPTLVTRAPGRVNLIGEHTDYNDGFVMPVAIEFATWTAAAARDDRTIRVHAGNRNQSLEFSLDDPGPPLQRHWGDYVRGIAVELRPCAHPLRGADLWFAGNVPDGAGLSSSAALEMSVGLALLAATGRTVDRTALARAGQRAEHHFAGTRCGIMDQFISAHAREGHALLLDCRSLETRFLPLPDSLRLVICDTGVKHALAGGEYNVRRAQCEEGVQHLRQFLPGLRALRDATPEHLAEYGGSMAEVVQRRCRHVVSENARVEQAADALRRHDLPSLRALLAASHASLRDDYEVSCPELDLLVDLAQAAPGVAGARMTGGGFGGCTVNLVETGSVEAFTAAVGEGYARASGRPPRIFVSKAAPGASVEPE